MPNDPNSDNPFTDVAKSIGSTLGSAANRAGELLRAASNLEFASKTDKAAKKKSAAAAKNAKKKKAAPAKRKTKPTGAKLKKTTSRMAQAKKTAKGKGSR